MAVNKTPNYDLNKPDYTEIADIPGHFNANFDIIDTAMKNNADAATAAEVNAKSFASGLIGTLSNLLTTAKNNIVAAVNEIFGKVDDVEADLLAHKAEDVTQAGGVHGLVVESGVWTPQLRGYEAGDDSNTYEMQNGTYLRIGSIVFITFEIKLSAKSPDMLNRVEIKGLPFYSKNQFNVGISFYNDINITSGIVTARTVNNVIPLRKQDSDSWEALSVSSITDTTHIQGSGLIEL